MSLVSDPPPGLPEGIPAHYGYEFAPPWHQNAEGPTDPTNTKLPRPFVVAIIGAGNGIGKHTALAYAKAGASGIVITSRNQKHLDIVESEILAAASGTNPRILSYILQATDEDRIREFRDAVSGQFGRLDVLVISAGIDEEQLPRADGLGYWASGLRSPTANFLPVMDVNLIGAYLATHYLLPLVEKTKDGPQTIVTLGSTQMHLTNDSLVPCTMSYSLSKMAVARLMEIVADPEGPHAKEGVCAFTLHPGSVKTALSDNCAQWEEGFFDWKPQFVDDLELCGGFCVWATKEKRTWLSGRMLLANYDVTTLERRKQEILEKDLLKMRMVV